MGAGGSRRQHDTDADGRKKGSSKRRASHPVDSSRVVLALGPEKPQTAKQRLLADAVPLIVSTAVFMWSMKWAMGALDPNKDQKRAGKRRGQALSKRLGRKIELQDLEQVICQDVIFPENVNVTLNDIGGLEPVEEILRTKVLLPLQRPDLFRGSLLRLDKGILLYGPPGTGKTMLAKALAKESGAAFINISASSMQSKWYGETSRLVAALFRLARKIAPTIIFIDEVDALLGRRKDGDHEATTTMKTEFMQFWDGLLPAEAGQQILVLGATNRPYELDAAVMRRFSLQLEVPMPGPQQRQDILAITLRQHVAEGGHIDPQLLAAHAAGGQKGHKPPLQRIAEEATGLSGSDLHQLCSLAASKPILELAQSSTASPYSRPRPLEEADFRAALAELRAARAGNAAHLAAAATYLMQQRLPIGGLPNGNGAPG